METILVIDDDADCRAAVVSALAGGYAVECAMGGNEGLRMARSLLPSAIVLDVMMPGGRDGLSVLCELRRDARTADIPVLLLSAVNEVSGLDMRSSDLEQYLGSAPEAFLEKPAKPEILRETLETLLGRGRPAKGSR